MSKDKIRAFESNEVIKKLMENEAWTISDISEHKKPLDIKKLTTKFIGAPKPNEDYNPLVKYQDINKYIPFSRDDLTNVAYRFNGINDDYCVLDIESVCPDNLKQELLKLPYLYGEYSWSGKGYHLIFPFPKDTKIEEKLICALKEKKGAYEILINHYCTFTRNTLPKIRNDKNNPNPDGFNKLFKTMAKSYLQKQQEKRNINIKLTEELNGIPDLETLERKLDEIVYKKTPDDFLKADNKTQDRSAYEFGYMGYIHYILKKYINETWGNVHYYNHQFTDNEIAHLLYRAAVRNIEPRSKWEEKRTGLPYLLYVAKSIVEKSN